MNDPQPRPDLHITVEGVQPESTAPHPTPRGAPACPHRILWRDKNPVAKCLAAEETVIAVAAIAMAVLCFVGGPAFVLEDRAVSEPALVLIYAAAFIPAWMLGLGAVEILRGQRRMHSTDSGVYGLHLAAFLLLLLVLIVTAHGREWALLTALPAFRVVMEHRWSRKVFRHRSTCAAEPGLPHGLAESTSKWTDDGPAEAPRPPADDGEDWRCPHFTDWKELRPWAIAEFFVHRWIALGYFGGVGILLATVVVDRSAYLIDPIDELIGVFGVFVLIPLVFNLVANIEWRLREGAHRESLGTYLWSVSAYAITGTLAGWSAQLLDRPYLWAVAALAAVALYLTLCRYRLYTDLSECRSRPELHPRLQARLKV
ncbi:hypothetical protein [Glycomyces paridis]|uniref:Uncharacterized protein n=1 Tax=Glycomyces paridis TaxID=2126555 RepID=A0A4S8P2A2_9ACTN|nr:hypothetical protein [Glycomyces paridis]THV21689.1 hypothetical protein E9998_24725 [Glycomyces paridis]